MSGDQVAIPPVSGDSSVDIDEIRSIHFSTSRRGYATEEVSKAMSRLIEILDRLQGDLSVAKAELVREREVRASVEGELEEKRAALIDFSERLSGTMAEQERLAVAILKATREREDILSGVSELQVEREERIAYTERLEEELGRYRDLEDSMAHSIVAAERTGNEIRNLAEREATLIMEKARVQVRELLYESLSERDRLFSDARAIRSMLSSALAILNERGFSNQSED